MAKLQMVMNPLSTSFSALEQSAISFAKQYGISIEHVLDSMRVFAQQGLSQQEVLDRTKTATVAENITDLSSTDATEALTAAMRVFNTEGEGSMRFLDSWSEVESKAAIKAGDLADAIKKAASAGKNAGFTFDQLNGMVAAIGSTTRQTGKEVGTSLRFIFNRLSTEKGPKTLGQFGISTQDINTGQLRSGFDVLSDLSEQWDELTRAQKLNVAQALGGTRQYNAVLTLMDNWDETLRSVTNSINSKGSAERRNAILMKTYAKQVEQLKAAAGELKIEFGKIVLPGFKVGVTSLKTLIELFNNIPTEIKLAGAAFTAFFAYMIKGSSMTDSFFDHLNKGKAVFRDLKTEFKKGLDMSAYELFGIGDSTKNSNMMGLKTIKQGATLSELEGPFSKLGYLALSTGRDFNSFLSLVSKDTGKAANAVGSLVKSLGEGINYIGTYLGMGANLIGQPELAGMVKIGTKVASKPLEFVGEKTSGLGKYGIDVADYIKKNATGPSAGIVQSVGPMLGVAAAGGLALPQLIKIYKRLSESAEEYKNSLNDEIGATEKEQSTVRALISEYERMDKAKKKLTAKAVEGALVTEDSFGNTKGIATQLAKLEDQYTDFKNKVATSDINFVVGYTLQGDAVLKGGMEDNLAAMLRRSSGKKQFEVAGKKMDIAARFANEATQTDGIQSWKYHIKEIVKNFPLIGEKLGDAISVGPKKAMYELQKSLHKMLTAKNANPLSNAFDDAIKELQERQIELRAAIKIDAKQAKNIIDSIDTSDMSPLEINATFNKAIYDDLYELLSMSSTMYKRAGVTGGDVRGQYVLSAANPNYKNYLAPTADLTMERFRNTGLMPRIGSGETMPVKVGDILKLSETASKDLGGVSGRQAILGSERYEESGKVLTKYFLSFADAEGKYRKKFIPGIKALDGMVQAAVSLSEVSNKLTGDFASLSEMVTGASAGMSALDKKSLTKRSVSLGPKFYSDIATEVLLQTNKGYDVKTRSYTTPAYKANYTDEFINNYAEKMEQWETTLASYRASDKPADTKLTGGFGEQLKELQDVLKNNSVVMQFRSALEDLSKTIEDSDAALVKNIALEKRRYEVQKNLSGLMAGIPEGLENFDVGTFELKDLSASQRMLYDNRGSQELVKAFNIEKKRQDAYTSQMDAITSTMLDVQRINETSLGFSSRFTTQAEFDKYAETIRYTGGDLGSAEIVSAVDASSDLLNQSNTELIAIKTGIYEVADLLKSPEDRWSSKVEKAQIDVAKAEKGTWYSNKSVAGAMRIADLQRIQSATAAEGRSEEAALMEKDIGKLTKELISRTSVGDVVRSLTPISKDAQYKILNSAISESGYSAADIVDYMDRAAVANKDLTKRQQKSIKKGVGAYREATTKKEPSFFNTDTLGFGALGLSIFAGSSASRKNEQITELSKRMGNVQKEIATQGENPDPKLLTELEALKRAKEGAESSAMIGATLQQLSTTGFLTYAGSKAAMGNSDAATTKLMMGAVATHTLFKSMGMDNLKKVPEFAKDFDKFLKGLGEKIGTVVKNKDPKAVEEALKKHGSKVKDRINEAAKEYFIGLKKYSEIQGKETGKTDADVAVEVENAKKMYSSNKKAQEKRAAIEEEFAVQSDAGKQFVLDLVKLETAMGLVRAAFSDAASDAKIAGMENTAEEQTKIFFDKIYSVSPKFANDIISSIVSGRDVDTLPIERGEPIKGPSTAFNVEDSINAVLAELHDQLAAVGDDYSKSSQLLAVLASATALKKRFTTLITTLETFNRSLHDSITSMELSAKYQGPSTFGDVLKGYIGDIKTAQSYSEFSPQQQLYAGGSGAFKELITDYQKGSKLMDKYVTALSNFESEVYSSEETIKSLEEKFNMLKNSGEATDGELEATAQTLSDNKKILETRRKVLKDTTTEADKLSKSMKNVQRALEFQTAFKGFQDSLANATANIFIQSEAGLKAYYDQRDKLLGGSHPEAAIAISVEDQRLADSLGMSLTSGVSSQYDLQRVKLEDAYIKAQESGNYEEMESVQTQLDDLDTQRKRDVITYEQKKQNELAAASIQPAATLYENLEKLRFTKPDVLSTEQFTDIDRLNSIIKDNLSKAYSEKISGADRIAELEKFKADKGYFEGSKEALAIDKIISTIKPDDTMYRGANPVEIKAAYDELMSKYSKFAVNEEQQNLMTYVNEPLKGILNYVKVIAAKIAPEATAALEEAMSGREGSKKTDYKDWQFYAKADDSEKYRELLGLDRKENKSKPTDDWQFYTGKSNFSDVNSDDYRALMGLNKLEDYGFKTTDSSYGEKEADLGFSKKSEKETKPIGMGDFGAKSNDPLFTGNFPKEYGKPLLSFESIGEGLNASFDIISSGLKASAAGISKGLAALGNMLETLANGDNSGVSADNKFSTGGPFGDHPSSIGGHVSGPGGPREDKVAAYLSPGEFVIRAHTAQQIGYANLDHMNRKGTLPTAMAADGGLIPAFADGGFIDSITKGRGFRNVSGGMQSLIDDLEAGRLSSVKEEGLSLKGIGKQASFATGELISRLTKIPLDVFSGIEGASDYLANKGLSGALKSVSKIKDSVLNKVATEGIMGTVSGVGSSLYSSITDSLSKGGLGITTDVIGSLVGGTGVMSKFNKLTDVGNYIKAAKAASGEGKISKVRDMLSVLTNESGAIDNPAMVVKDIVSKSKPKVERKFPSLYDRFSPMKKDPKRKGGYNRDMLAIDKFNREYTDKYGVDFGFSRENFLPRQFLPDMGKTIDSYMERYPELKDHLSFVGSTEFTQNMPVDDALRLAAEVGDPLHNRGRHTVIPTRQGPAGVVQISNENAIKKHFVKAQKDNIPLQSVAGDVKDDLLYTLGHELSHGINRASKNKIQMTEINAVLDKLPGDVFESTYISSKKVGDPARAKERFADFGAKFEKIMADPNRKDNPTMFDMSPEDAVAEVYGYDTRLTSWGDDMVSNLFPDMKFANGGAVGGYVLDPERYLDNKRLDMAKAIYEEEHRKVREAGNSKTSSWLEEFNKKSAQFKKEQWEGRAAEEVDPKKVRSFTNIGPGGDILSEIVETTGKSYDPSRTISGIDDAINNPIYEKSWSAQDITDYLNNSISGDNNMRRGKDHLPHKWGYDTAAAAQSNVMVDAKSKADDRLLKAVLSDTAFKTNAEQILSTRRGLEKDLAKHIKDKGSIAGIEESMKYGDYAFDPYRGVHKFTTNVGGRDVSAGVIEQSSYRYANKAYRPTNIKPSKKAIPHSNMWTKTYKDLIPQEEFGMDFKRQVPKRGTVDSVALKYYKDAKFINQRIGNLFEKLHDENLDPKDRLKYIKQLDFQSKAMSAYSKFDEVMREGENPFTDPRLVEETTKRVPNRLVRKSLAGVEGVEPIKSEDGKETIGFKLPSGKTISAYEQVTEKRSLLKLIEKAGNKAYIDMYKRKPLSAGSVTKAPIEAEMLSKSWFDKQNHGSAVSKRYTTGNSGAFGKLKEYGTVKDTDSNYFGVNTSVPDMVNSMLENFYKSRKKSDWESGLNLSDWVKNYAAGGSPSLSGHVSGPGGPREDKVPALLSPGEFVVRADSAQQIGYANLDHMNKKGSIPTFADGGSLGNVPTTTPSTNFTNTSANLSLNVPKIELDVSEAISELRSVVLKVDKTPVKVDTKSVELPAVNIDSRELLSELSKIELRLEDKLVQVDTTSLKDITLKVEDKKLSLEEGTKVEVDVSNISAAATEAGFKISQAITNAIKSASVKIEVASTGETGQVGQGVGAERLDLLATTIDNMDKRLINTTTKIETEVKELEVNLESKLSKDIDARLASKLSGVQEDLTNLGVSVSSLSDNVTSQISRVSMSALEAARLAKQALDFRNLK
jgi:TP901 family phage tail tape measure protein